MKKFLSISILGITIFFGLSNSLLAYTGPSGILFESGIAPNTYQDIHMTGGANHSIFVYLDGAPAGMLAYNAGTGAYLWDSAQGVNENAPNGTYELCNSSLLLGTITDNIGCTPDDGIFEYFAGEINSTATRIISFSPDDGETVTGPNVEFNLHAYISPDDIGDIIGIKILFHNIDQNVLFLGSQTQSDIYIFEGQATTSGDFFYSATYPIADGNYRLNVVLERSYFRWFENSFALSIDESHQFVVGTSTFIGNINQNSFNELQNFIASTTATSTVALAESCTILQFNLIKCFSAIFIPDMGAIQESFTNLRTGFLSYAPWGYVTRFMTILTSSATTSPAIIDVTFPASFPAGMAGQSFVINPWIAMEGPVFTAENDETGQTILDVFMPWWNLIVYSGLFIAIVHELIAHSAHHTGKKNPFGDKVSAEEYRYKEKLYAMSKRK